METQPTILEGYTDLEKGAYLGALASLATADRAATEEELDYIEALAESANLSEPQKKLILQAATTPMADRDLNRCLDTLKNSELRFSLVSDLIAFAQSDKNYSEEEKQTVEKIAAYLQVNQAQFSLLDQFTNKAVQEVPAQASALQTEQTSPKNFLDGLGFGDKLRNAGINTDALMKGALGILGPIVLARMFSGGRRRGGGMFGGGGGLLGGLLGGGGGLLGGLLGGGRGFGGAGGMLGRLLRGNRGF
jgi:uncharacterized tellurite resistance protein B-like protein